MSLVDWSIFMLAPLCISISFRTMPDLPSSQPTHFCSTCISESCWPSAPPAAWICLMTSSISATFALGPRPAAAASRAPASPGPPTCCRTPPPGATSDSEPWIRCCAIWMPMELPETLTVLKPMSLKDWSMLILQPVSASISLMVLPPLPRSQPTHFCSICSSTCAWSFLSIPPSWLPAAPAAPIGMGIRPSPEGFTRRSLSAICSKAAEICCWFPVIVAMLYPRPLLSWFMDTLAPPAACSISLTTVPPFPSSQPTHCWSTCTCMLLPVVLTPFGPWLVADNGEPPTFWSVVRTRDFAASTLPGSPATLTVL
mmetsp:Transcript_56370/g.160013  ORF Transcript_56370/g.160013 Transcript_56370/m.160013 type:complete len:313 (-) Transcript_56370:993-1931(-)